MVVTLTVMCQATTDVGGAGSTDVVPGWCGALYLLHSYKEGGFDCTVAVRIMLPTVSESLFESP